MSLALGPSTGLRLSPLLLTVRHTPSACVHPSTGAHLVCCGVQGRAQDWEGQLTGKLPATCLTGSPYGPHLWGENSGEVDSQHLPPALPTLPAEAPFSRRTLLRGRPLCLSFHTCQVLCFWTHTLLSPADGSLLYLPSPLPSLFLGFEARSYSIVQEYLKFTM